MSAVSFRTLIPGLLLISGALIVPVLAADLPPDVLQGNPFRGRELLSEKLCTQCHAVWGHGGILGPDLSTAVVGKTWHDLVGDFWNHTPRMIDAMTGQGRPWPTLDRAEMSDLLAYLYYLRIFDRPGDPLQGSFAYTRLRCDSCHILGGEGSDVGGELDRFSAYASPLELAQSMWNAGPGMQREQLGQGRTIPVFTANDMANIQAHIRARGWRTDRRVELLPLPVPSEGALVFAEKRCVACHGPSNEGPELHDAVVDMTVSQISGILWNHSYAMQDRMRSMGIPFPRFEGNEMADLIAYLHFLGFLSARGDRERGREVLRLKGCAQCHDSAEAVDLLKSEQARDPIGLSAAMWNHAPEMHNLMAERSIAWPRFDPGEMGDLAAYLRSSSSPNGSQDP